MTEQGDQFVGATPASPTSASPPPAPPDHPITQSSRANPVPLGKAILAGPLELRVRDVLAGAAAVDEGSLLLLFDSVERDGSWADSVLALQDGAHIPDRAQPVAAPNTAGTDVGAALGVGEAAITGEWSVELRDVVSGAAA